MRAYIVGDCPSNLHALELTAWTNKSALACCEFHGLTNVGAPNYLGVLAFVEMGVTVCRWKVMSERPPRLRVIGLG